MNGILLVNKPKGISSFDVIRKLRRITGFKKIGHAGTLDPLATGLMIMLFGSATKAASNYSILDKVYEAELTLGFESTTGDAEGELNKINNDVPTAKKVETVLNSFVGQQDQTPPQFSAIKVGGQRAYKLARKGQEVEIPSRKVTIHSTKLNDYRYPLITFTAKVSSGTYIRSLAQDIGQKLGAGAYLSKLARAEIGDFKLVDAVDLDTSAEQINQTLISL